jgi:hypothetical protein
VLVDREIGERARDHCVVLRVPRPLLRSATLLHDVFDERREPRVVRLDRRRGAEEASDGTDVRREA